MARLLSVEKFLIENPKADDFSTFWACYPRKKAKLDAMKAWEQTKKLRPPIEELIAAVNKLALATDDVGFCPYPASWLRAGQWMDE